MMRRLGELIGERAREVAVVESIDNGKLIREMEGQLPELKTVWIELTGGHP